MRAKVIYLDHASWDELADLHPRPQLDQQQPPLLLAWNAEVRRSIREYEARPSLHPAQRSGICVDCDAEIDMQQCRCETCRNERRAWTQQRRNERRRRAA